ncbi:MAG: FAD-dependent oxidoreductase [Deltaproteobacteria bacterium]|nr:FAD-dependent oxidoreductase [Deltaproteobacteria bacterium]
MSEQVDAVVVGAGVVGLACAYALSQKLDSVVVIERDVGPGREISSRNSGVIHAGIYYPNDSLKTRLCIEGNRRLYEWCETHEVPYKRTGKLIVATSPHDEERLQAIARHAKEVGAADLQLLTGAEASPTSSSRAWYARSRRPVARSCTTPESRQFGSPGTGGSFRPPTRREARPSCTLSGS